MWSLMVSYLCGSVCASFWARDPGSQSFKIDHNSESIDRSEIVPLAHISPENSETKVIKMTKMAKTTTHYYQKKNVCNCPKFPAMTRNPVQFDVFY